MRPYATISPLFWTGTTGKRLRSNPDAQRVALYLITSPHSHQTGLYYLPLMYLCHEVGISEEGACKALQSLSSDGFCRYDADSEWVWVCEMAGWQIGTNLEIKDKRCKGVQQYLGTLPSLGFVSEFIEKYASDFHLQAPSEGSISPLQGPSSDQKGSGTEQEHNTPEAAARSAAVDDAPASRRRGTRIQIPFTVTDVMLTWATKDFPNVDVKAATAEFEDYWKGVAGAKGVKLDWEATWRNRIRDVASRAKPRTSYKGTPSYAEPARAVRRFGA